MKSEKEFFESLDEAYEAYRSESIEEWCNDNHLLLTVAAGVYIIAVVLVCVMADSDPIRILFSIGIFILVGILAVFFVNILLKKGFFLRG
jgi:hypothetical protein